VHDSTFSGDETDHYDEAIVLQDMFLVSDLSHELRGQGSKCSSLLTACDCLGISFVCLAD
jgi:hypothetical protein